MPSPRSQRPGRPHLERDRQQWIFDYVVQQSGKVFHWWSEGERLPEAVRSHAMISKHLGREAERREADAAALAAAGKEQEALERYYAATKAYGSAQHTVFETNAEKLFLYAGLRRCYDEVIARAPHRIERIDVPFEGNVVTGFLHLCPDVERAPLLFYFPGCDGSCEGWPNPTRPNPAFARGMHVFSVDGPGQPQSNVRGIKLTADNNERAASAALDLLVGRPEIDEERIIGFGGGMGSFYALRAAALDERFKAAATKSSYADKYYIMNEESPRWKQLFAYCTQAESEEELDAFVQAFTLDGYMSQIRCPVFMATGEYDHRDPLDEVYGLFDQLTAPGELWVFADRFHQIGFSGGAENFGLYGQMLDWALDRLDGKPMPNAGEVLYVESGSESPDSPGVSRKRYWYETGH